VWKIFEFDFGGFEAELNCFVFSKSTGFRKEFWTFGFGDFLLIVEWV
jgi:hypothetical protein